MRAKSFRFTRLEDKFFSNLNAKEELGRAKAPVKSMIKKKMDGYDVHIRNVSVTADFSYIGKTLREMPFRHNSGANVVKIQRGSHSILVPRGDEVIYPGDILAVVGTEAQLDAFDSLMKTNTISEPKPAEDFNIEKIVLQSDSDLVGMKLGDTDMRSAGCMVVSVDRNGALHTNPGKDFIFEEGDNVWLAGLQSSIDWYKK